MMFYSSACGAELKQEKYIFYITSGSVPFVSVQSIIEQSQKINTRLVVVLNGMDKERVLLKRLEGVIKGKKALVKMHPYIIEDVGVNQVPAFISAICPEYAAFKSDECKYENIVYGDISLSGFLKIVKEHDRYFATEYDRIKGI